MTSEPDQDQQERAALEELMRDINDLILTLSACHEKLTQTTRIEMQDELRALKDRCAELAGIIFHRHLRPEYRQALQRRKDDLKA